MPERVVVSFRGSIPAEGEAAPAYLERALALKQKAEALGATLCAWSAQTFSFDFAPDDLEEAVSLALLAPSDETVAPENRFGAGIAQGDLHVVGQSTGLAALKWGRPLLVAVSLARVARPGEVLVDPELPARKSGELLVTGPRIALDGAVRVRGQCLDVVQPWRSQAARSVTRLTTPPLIGRDAVLAELDLPVGCLAVVRAEPGAGGSRILSEACARHEPSRVLYVAPVGAGKEPLGALRRALARSVALGGTPDFPERLRGALDRLLAGEGVDLWAAAEIVDTMLAPSGGRFGVVALDDAADVDETTLDAIAQAMAVRQAFRAIVRVGKGAPLPAPLAAMPAGPAIELGPLHADSAERLVAAFANDRMSADAVRRWARRGSGLPLGTREALAEGLTSGELSWKTETAEPRSRAAGRGGTIAAPRQWIERRLKYLAPGERAALTALALLGGDAPDPMVDELSVAMAGLGARTAVREEALVAGGWVVRPEPGWLRLTSRTAMVAIVETMDPAARAEWHIAASEMLAQHVGPLGKADAAWHASVGGDKVAAARLAIEAARAAAKASLESAASALLAFAHQCDRQLAEAARRESIRTPRGTIPPPPSRPVIPLDGLEEGVSLPPSSQIDPPPPRPPLDSVLDEVFAQFELPGGSKPPPAPPSESTTRVAVVEPPPPPRAPLPSQPFAAVLAPDEPLPPKSAAQPGSGSRASMPTIPPPIAAARDALLQGDLAALEEIVPALRETGTSPGVAERISGLAALGRGARADALRRLRAASRADGPAAQRARALLAYAIALGTAGRPETALLEALEALARAREARDDKGELACKRFLALLSKATGHERAARAWEEAASTSASGR